MDSDFSDTESYSESDSESDSDSNDTLNPSYMMVAYRRCGIGRTLRKAYKNLCVERYCSEEAFLLFWIPNGDTTQHNKLPTAIGTELIYVYRPSNPHTFEFISSDGFDFSNGPKRFKLISPDRWSSTHPCHHPPITYEDICRSSEANTPSPEAS